MPTSENNAALKETITNTLEMFINAPTSGIRDVAPRTVTLKRTVTKYCTISVDAVGDAEAAALINASIDAGVFDSSQLVWTTEEASSIRAVADKKGPIIR